MIIYKAGLGNVWNIFNIFEYGLLGDIADGHIVIFKFLVFALVAIRCALKSVRSQDDPWF